ncbi:MAG: prepilin-type N-terminal cleavage/methylation domain-containing protein [Gammaproteobacteria bacterium]|nr:prepilin-type N-terminal cleavage/methylation domain-containing protein [Gammaproteobacteria bacterium]
MAAQREQGFSLIEMVVVIVIVGIVFGIGALLVGRGLGSFDDGQRIDQAAWQARVALDRIDRELRMVRSPTPADLGLGANTLTFTTLRGTTYSDTLVGTVLQQSVNGGTPQVLAQDVSQFAVQYWEADGATPAPTAAAVRFVAVSLTVTAAGTQVRYQVLMDPRDFP